MKRLLILAALLFCTPAWAQQSQATHVLSAASTNATSVKPAAGQLITVYGWAPERAITSPTRISGRWAQ